MVELFPGTGGIEPALPSRHECSKCGPTCLPRVRADTPPANWLDLIDRQSLLLCSGHWSWKPTLYVAGLVLALSAPFVAAVVVGLILGSTGAVVGGGAGILGGAGLIAGAISWVRRRHRHLPVPSPSPPADDSGSTESGAPRAA
ncbi:hypothetical protein [Nocardia iowensis]|uniref:Uncharacterized protein n=1 Tax=Nocardia iowensis TaxID=204891 RepID=A0ABX8S0W4_NOCIO|nr:hypothetical protein [Nocardia iowensis]QXN94727.1 hypothetical protein KV110_17755 [Nocardia iowensis]